MIIIALSVIIATDDGTYTYAGHKVIATLIAFTIIIILAIIECIIRRAFPPQVA